MPKHRILKPAVAVLGLAAAFSLAAALGLVGASASVADAAVTGPAHAAHSAALASTEDHSAPAGLAVPDVTNPCTSGWVCVYADGNYFDGPAMFMTGNAFWGDFPSDGACVAGSTAAADDTNGSWNDCMSSVHNETSNTMFFYVNADCKGDIFPLSPGGSLAGLNPIDGINFNDKVSSDFVTTC